MNKMLKIGGGMILFALSGLGGFYFIAKKYFGQSGNYVAIEDYEQILDDQKNDDIL